MSANMIASLGIFLASTVFSSEPIDPQVGTPSTFKGEFTLTIPAGRSLQRISLKVDVEQSRDLVETEDQEAVNPSEVIFVGRRKDIKVSRDRRGRFQMREGQEKEGVLFVYPLAPVYEIKAISFRPRFYTVGDVFHDRGITDSIFALDIIEVDGVGETEGQVVKTIDGLSFQIGAENQVQIHYRLNMGKRLALRLRSTSSNTAYLHVPVNNLGTYPGIYLENGNRSRKIFNPPVSVSFILSPEVKDIQREIPMRHLTRDVNRYLQSHPSYGMEGIIDIPVRLEMELAPEEKVKKVEPAIKGPAGPPKMSDEKPKNNPFFDF